jgi:hypothetical protein
MFDLPFGKLTTDIVANVAMSLGPRLQSKCLSKGAREKRCHAIRGNTARMRMTMQCDGQASQRGKIVERL